MRLALALLLSGCGTGKDQFDAFDSGIPADAGVWVAGEVLTCSHDPLPAYDVTTWDLADDFPRDQIGGNYVVPTAGVDVWSIPFGEEFLQGVGGGDAVGQAIRTDPKSSFSGLQTVVYVDVSPVDLSVDLATVYCRMENVDPPAHYYGARLKADRLTVVEGEEEVAEIEHNGFQMGHAYRVILSCQDRERDTLVTAFLYEVAGGVSTELGCVHHFDGSSLGAGSVGLGLRGGTVAFDGLRVHLP